MLLPQFVEPNEHPPCIASICILFFFSSLFFGRGGVHCFLCYVDKFCAVLNYYLMSNGDIKCSLNVHVLAGLLFAIVGFLFGWTTIENITCQLGLRL